MLRDTLKMAGPQRHGGSGGAQPLYLQVFEVLRARLEAGRWKVGDVLPAIPELMDEFKTSRITVRQALSMLEAQGIVRKRQGLGTTVERDLSGTRWVNIPSTLAQLVATMDTVRPEVLNIERGAKLPDVPLPHDETAAKHYVRMRRVHMQQGAAYCLIDLVLETSLYERDAKRFERLPVISVMAQVPGLKISSARQQLTIRAADYHEAEHLKIEPGEPVAEVRRTIADEQGVVIYAAVVLYPSRSVRLEMNLLAGAPA